MKEAALRDLIAQQINKLKPGLVLLQKEQSLRRNSHQNFCSIRKSKYFIEAKNLYSK